MLLEFEDAVQEMQLLLVEILNKIDLTKFPKDDSDGLTRYIAKSLGHKFTACKIKNSHGADNLDITQFEFRVYDKPTNTILLQEMLSKLNKTQRKITVYKLSGFSDAEIGKLLGMSRQAVNKHVRKARIILKEYWEE